ncbi:MAG: hypothetical protein RBR28_07935 [Lentimicrobium sp.]|jgi:hypothetical protein|nr:hypothetical protein [Lentimicrobium sp.]
MIRYLFLVIALTVSFLNLTTAQNLPEHTSNHTIYLLLDELATQGIIELNAAVKPYSRDSIAGKLMQARSSDKLSHAQRGEVERMLKDYFLETGTEHRGIVNLTKEGSKTQVSMLPPIFTYQDSLFRVRLEPVYGANFISNSRGEVRHTYGGLAMQAYIGNQWSVWASLRDNYQTNQVLSLPGYFSKEEGGNYKIGVQGRSGGDYSEMRGGIAWAWRWGSLSFSKDHLQWGDNYHGSNILSGRTPSYAMIKLQLDPAKWFSFTYHHGWLVSEVIDSARSYYSEPERYRAVFRPKYIAANIFTFKPWRKLNVSVGNSVVYSDDNVQPAYLIPFMFFKSIDHTLTHGIDNQNSQMFLNISSRQISYLHLFTSVYIDEFSISRVGDANRHNFASIKVGGSLSGWPFNNITLRGEYTRSSPITYQHRVKTLTFETNRYNLGHYLRDNSQEIYASLSWRPIAGLYACVSFVLAEHGNNYTYDLDGAVPVDEHPFMETITWRNRTTAIDVRYMLWNNISVFATFTISNIAGFDVDGISAQRYLNQYTPDLYQGKNNTLNIGFQMGF